MIEREEREDRRLNVSNSLIDINLLGSESMPAHPFESLLEKLRLSKKNFGLQADQKQMRYWRVWCDLGALLLGRQATLIIRYMI